MQRPHFAYGKRANFHIIALLSFATPLVSASTCGGRHAQLLQLGTRDQTICNGTTTTSRRGRREQIRPSIRGLDTKATNHSAHRVGRHLAFEGTTEARGAPIPRGQFVPAMTPPSRGTSTRSATDAYRRPVNCLAPDNWHDAGPESRPTSPSSRRRRRSGRYGTAPGSASRPKSEYDDSEHIEVIEKVYEKPLRCRDRRQPGHDVGTDTRSDGKHRDYRTRPYSEEDLGWRGRHAASDSVSAAPASSKTPDRSMSSRTGRRHHVSDVIEDTRPPLSSKR